MTTDFANKIKGWMPALDAKQVTEKHVINGQNFLVDAEGPYSAFGAELLSYARLFKAENSATFEVDIEIFIFTDDGVFIFDPLNERYVPIFVFPSTFTSNDPWTHAEVGGFHYFMKTGSGLIEYAHEEGLGIRGVWSIRNDPDMLPGGRFITNGKGRLVILSDEATQWSDLDDGRSFTPDPNKGTGFQLNAIVGTGRALGVYQTVDGFISYTTTGAMKAKFIKDTVNFNFDELADTPVPLSPHCIIETEREEHIYLSKQGFYQTAGRVPEPWQPLFNEYLVRKLFTDYDVTINGAIKLTYNNTKKILGMSFATTQIPFSYNIAAAIYTPTAEWGIFNRIHTVVGEYAVNEGLFPGRNFGYVDQDNFVYKFTDNAVFEEPPYLPDYYYWKQTGDYQSREFNGVTIMPSTMRLETELETDYNNIVGLYNIKDQTIYNPDLQSVDSYVDVGLFRLTDDTYPNWGTTVQQVVASMNDPVGVDVFFDRNVLPDREIDRNTVGGSLDIFVDRGFGEVVGNNYDLSVMGTLDGYNQYYDQYEMATEVVFENIKSRSKFFACEVTGRYIVLRFCAQKQGQSYHLKFLETQGILSGKLQG